MDVQYPMWLPIEAWQEYLKMRKKIKSPLTEYGEKLAIKRLEVLRESGQDPQAVIEQSILFSWRGLFPVKDCLPICVRDQNHQAAREFAEWG